MASAALSMRLESARRRASGSAETSGRLGARARRTRMLPRRPAKRAREFSTMELMSAGRRRAVGNSASVANWSTRERMVETDDEMTSVARSMTAGELDSTLCSVSRGLRRPMWRWMSSALREMGVSGFLISWATRRATSFQADCFCARRSSETSSRTRT